MQPRLRPATTRPPRCMPLRGLLPEKSLHCGQTCYWLSSPGLALCVLLTHQAFDQLGSSHSVHGLLHLETTALTDCSISMLGHMPVSMPELVHASCILWPACSFELVDMATASSDACIGVTWRFVQDGLRGFGSNLQLFGQPQLASLPPPPQPDSFNAWLPQQQQQQQQVPWAALRLLPHSADS